MAVVRTRRGALRLAAGGAAAALLAGVRSDATSVPRATLSTRLRLAADPTGVAAEPPGCFGHGAHPVALTFDDGPDPRFTPWVLDLLDRHAMTATFFVVAVNLRAYPDLGAEIVRRGHELANHSHAHEHLDELDGEEVFRSLDDGSAAVAAAGSSSRLFRSPWGRTSPIVAEWARRRGRTELFWSQSLDGSVSVMGPRRASAYLGERLCAGDVLLAHDGGRVVGSDLPVHDRGPDLRLLDGVLARLADRGLRGETAGALLAQAGASVVVDA